MKIRCVVDGNPIVVEAGLGHNSIRWLAIVAAHKLRNRSLWNVFRAPIEVKHIDTRDLGPRSRIDIIFNQQEPVDIKLSGYPDDETSLTPVRVGSWFERAFGKSSYLCEKEIRWIPSRVPGESIPQKVKGTISVGENHMKLFRVPSDRFCFEIPLEPIESGSGTFDWVAKLRGPPGLVRFAFLRSDGSEIISPDFPTNDRNNQLVIECDVPVSDPLEYKEHESIYTAGFLEVWEALVIPESWKSGASLAQIKLVLFQHFDGLLDLFKLVSCFHSPSMVTTEDVAYLCGELFEGRPVSVSRTEFINTLIERCDSTEALRKFTGKDFQVFKEELMKWPLFPRVMLSLRRLFDSKRLDPILTVFPEHSTLVTTSTTFLGFIESLLESLGSVSEFARRFKLENHD